MVCCKTILYLTVVNDTRSHADYSELLLVSSLYRTHWVCLCPQTLVMRIRNIMESKHFLICKEYGGLKRWSGSLTKGSEAKHDPWWIILKLPNFAHVENDTLQVTVRYPPCIWFTENTAANCQVQVPVLSATHCSVLSKTSSVRDALGQPRSTARSVMNPVSTLLENGLLYICAGLSLLPSAQEYM